MRAATLARGVPLYTADIELSEPIDVTTFGVADDGTSYAAAILLVRLHGAPLGEITVALPTSTQALFGVVRDQLGAEVAAHLEWDGIDPAVVLGQRQPPVMVQKHCRQRPEASALTPSVSVVVATCGRPAQAARCVASLLASRFDNFEVIIVDNDPAEGSTRDALGPHLARDGRLRYLVDPRRGASRARNTGIDAARKEVVAFTDDDVIVDRDWLPSVAGVFASHPHAACVTGLTLPYRLETAAQRDFERASGFSGGYSPLGFHRDMVPRPTLLFPFTSGIVGASNNMAVRSGILRQLGGFDVRLGPGTQVGGAEDLDLLTRILLEGGEVRYEPCALVRHEHRMHDGAVARQIFSYGAGATAMLTKWVMASPALRRRIAGQARPIARELMRTEVVRIPAVATGEPMRPPEKRLRRARVLGCACGPALWLLALGRAAQRS